MNLIGDVRGKVAVMVTRTIAKGAALLHQEGAREVYACSIHAVFSPPSIERLSSGLFQEVIIMNTILVMEQNYFPQLSFLSVANLLGETILRVHNDCSDGVFKIRRGTNEYGIEDDEVAGLLPSKNLIRIFDGVDAAHIVTV